MRFAYPGYKSITKRFVACVAPLSRVRERGSNPAGEGLKDCERGATYGNAVPWSAIASQRWPSWLYVTPV